MTYPADSRKWADEDAFAWMREEAPSVGDIEVVTDPASRERRIVLYGASEKDRKRLEVAIGLRFPFSPFRVEVRRGRTD